MKVVKTWMVGLLVAWLAVGWGPQRLEAQERVTGEQKRQIQRIKSGIDRAGRLYQSGKTGEAARLIGELSADLQEVVEQPSDALLAAVTPQHERLVQARNVLVEAGVQMAAIADLPRPSMLEGDTIGFSADVAPLLMTHCGACHVTRARGDFSMASFRALANGLGGAPVVVPEKPDESYLIELIAGGTMPPGNRTVPAEDLDLLRQWIAEGANYDRPDPAESLRDIAMQATRARNQANNPEITMAGDNQTVSFSLEVAPVLMENCMGCHFEARNAQGGLRIDNFRQLLVGGDSGAMVTPGDADNSPLVQRLEATDNTRMPRGRPPLDKADIARIRTWINEGAAFDGRSPQMNLREVSAIARAEDSTHEELSADRAAGARQFWKKVMLDEQPNQVSTPDFLLLGTVAESTLERIGNYAQTQSRQIRRELGIGNSQPLVKGQISVFVFQRRYDYNEFGKMVENRDLPPDWKLHWGYDTVNAWIALQIGEGGLDASLKPQLQQAIAALAVASSGSDVPRWFADGTGFMVAESMLEDKQLGKQWQAAAVEAAGGMNQATDFLRNRLPQDQAALVAYGFVSSLIENSRQFGQIMDSIRDGVPFGEIFNEQFAASPIELVEQRFGTGNRRQNRNRR